MLFALAFAALAALAIVLGPGSIPFLGSSEEDRIASERAQRRWRHAWGLAMPGQPDLARLPQRLAEHGVVEGAPVLVRIFKREFELELWLLRNGTYHRFATYPICRWSGKLGPKLAQGDHQAPEGFYTVDAAAMNPNSRWYRSFNLGYPNAFDKSLGRTGSLIMVHGGCGSVGCFAMTNAQMAEIWRLVSAAFSAGQQRFQVQVYPFRFSDERLAAYAGHPAMPFWRTLKAGHDLFEQTLLPPKVHACRGQYTFLPAQSPAEGEAVIPARCPADGAKS